MMERGSSGLRKKKVLIQLFWVSAEDLIPKMQGTYGNIRDVLDQALLTVYFS